MSTATNLRKSIRDALEAASSVTTALSNTYEFTTGSPDNAIFTVDPIPEDATMPAIVITQVGGFIDPVEDRCKRGALVDIDVRIFGDKDETHDSINTIAFAVWEALNRATLTISGYQDVGCIADPPLQSTDVDGFPFFLVPVRARIYEM